MYEVKECMFLSLRPWFLHPYQESISFLCELCKMQKNLIVLMYDLVLVEIITLKLRWKSQWKVKDNIRMFFLYHLLIQHSETIMKQQFSHMYAGRKNIFLFFAIVFYC